LLYARREKITYGKMAEGHRKPSPNERCPENKHKTKKQGQTNSQAGIQTQQLKTAAIEKRPFTPTRGWRGKDLWQTKLPKNGCGQGGKRSKIVKKGKNKKAA